MEARRTEAGQLERPSAVGLWERWEKGPFSGLGGALTLGPGCGAQSPRAPPLLQSGAHQQRAQRHRLSPGAQPGNHCPPVA